MKCDLHVHSYASYDSISSPKNIIKEAIKKGVDCVAITDHGEVKAFDEIKKYASGKGILVIKGIEVKSDCGDIIGLNVKERIQEGLSVEETIKRIKDQGGFVVIPHPFFKYYRFKKDLNNLLESIDAIEVLNASISKNANKIEIKKAVEKIFKVKVDNVRTIHCKGKKKKLGRFEGIRPDWKKAIVTLKKGEKLDFIEGV